MNNFLYILLFISVSCASTSKNKFEKLKHLPKMPSEGMGIIYVSQYNKWKAGSSIVYDYFIDEDKNIIASIQGDQYVYFELPPGKYKLISKKGYTMGVLVQEPIFEINLEIKSNEIKYFEQSLEGNIYILFAKEKNVLIKSSKKKTLENISKGKIGKIYSEFNVKK